MIPFWWFNFLVVRDLGMDLAWSHNDVSPTVRTVKSTATTSYTKLVDIVQASSASQSVPKCASECQKAIICLHKMGFTVQLQVTNIIFHNKVVVSEVAAHKIFGRSFETKYRYPATADYRHVIVTRNIYSSVVSGYLYHRSGRECWLDWYGRLPPKGGFFNGWLVNNTVEDWHNRIANVSTRVMYPWPDARGRDLCRYLADESETDGLRIYMEWAMAIYFRPFHQFFQERLEKEQRTNTTYRTAHICFEEQMQNFFDTTHIMTRYFDTPIENATLEQQVQRIQSGGAGHDTEKDPELRRRLKDIIRRLDNQLFNGTLALWDNQIGCGIQSKV